MQKFLTEIFCTHKSTFHPFKSPPNFWVQPSLQLILHYKKKKKFDLKKFSRMFCAELPKELQKFLQTSKFFSATNQVQKINEEMRGNFSSHFEVQGNFFTKFRQNFFQNFRLRVSQKMPKSTKKGEKVPFLVLFFGVLILVVIIRKYLWDTINSHKDIKFGGFGAQIVIT